MKAVLVVAAMAALTVVGAKTIGDSEKQAPSAAETQAQSDAAGGCWSKDDIRGDRFTMRGAEGAITSFAATNGEGCQFNVSIEYTNASGTAKNLNYVADFVAGESPTFIRYNTPP